jgi:hypothetical protein
VEPEPAEAAPSDAPAADRGASAAPLTPEPK